MWVRYDARSHYRDERRWLTTSADLAGGVRAAADDVADAARLVVLVEAFDTGALYGSIAVVRDDGPDRVGYSVVAEDPAAAPTVWGNRTFPRSEVVNFLTLAARRVGLDVRGED